MSQYLFGIGLKNGLVQSVKFQNIQAGDLPVVPGLNPGGYTNANIVVDQFGRITSAANGSGGGGSGTVTSVDVSGGGTGLTTSGGPVTTSGVITISGVLNAASGGTGVATLAAFTLLGNPTSASAAVSQITLGAGVGFSDTFLNANWTTSVVNDIEIPASSTTLVLDDPYVINSGQVTILDSSALLDPTVTDQFTDWVVSISPANVEIPPACTKTVLDDPYQVTINTVTILDATALLNLTVSDKFEDWVSTVALGNVEIPPNCTKTIVDDPYVVPPNTLTALDFGALLTLTTTPLNLTKIVYFTTPGSTNYAPSAGVKAILVRTIGGGGGGGGVGTAATNGGAAGGGGAGSFAQSFLQGPLRTSYPLTVGAAGNGATAGSNGGNGQSGGSTTFGTPVILSSRGGGGGIGDTIAAGPRIGGVGGAGGSSANLGGDFRCDGASGGAGLVLSANQVLSGATSPGFWGGGGDQRSGGNIGLNGSVAPGSGGGGAALINGGASVAGGAGTPGAVIIYEFS